MAPRLTQQPLTALTENEPSPRLTQLVLMALAPVPVPGRLSQMPLSALTVNDPLPRLTQLPMLVLAAPGKYISFSAFTNEDFEDWGSEDFESYMETYFIVPEQDIINWAQTPYLYTFLKQGGEDDNSLMMQAKWDWSRANG